MGDCCSDKACELEVLKRRQASTLRVVLGINALMFVVEFAAGVASGSVSLLADSLDMLGDALVYGFSLYAVARGVRAKALSAMLKGGIMAVFGLFALGQVIYRLAVPEAPVPATIGIVACLALLANGACLLLLRRRRGDDINMRSVWLCSRNDIIANVAVMAAAVGVWLSDSGWPDVVVGAGIALLFLKSAVTVLSEARRELRSASAV
ncbi:MAG TPA: cation transporter [Oleiagrimonas sp.]|nr:cation transporter [Oleiagrimonas sp.]